MSTSHDHPFLDLLKNTARSLGVETRSLEEINRELRLKLIFWSFQHVLTLLLCRWALRPWLKLRNRDIFRISIAFNCLSYIAAGPIADGQRDRDAVVKLFKARAEAKASNKMVEDARAQAKKDVRAAAHKERPDP
jgi:hypothetical protein